MAAVDLRGTVRDDADPQAQYLSDQYAVLVGGNCVADRTALLLFVSDVVHYWRKQREVYELLSNIHDPGASAHQCVLHKLSFCTVLLLRTAFVDEPTTEAASLRDWIRWDCVRCSACVATYCNAKTDLVADLTTAQKVDVKAIISRLADYDLARCKLSGKLFLSGVAQVNATNAYCFLADVLHDPYLLRDSDIINYVSFIIDVSLERNFLIHSAPLPLPGLVILALHPDDKMKNWAYDMLVKSHSLIPSNARKYANVYVAVSTLVLLLQRVTTVGPVDGKFHDFNLTSDETTVWRVFRRIVDMMQDRDSFSLLYDIQKKFNIPLIIIALKRMYLAKSIDDFDKSFYFFNSFASAWKSTFYEAIDTPKKQQECFNVVCLSPYFVDIYTRHNDAFQWILPSDKNRTHSAFWGNVFVVALLKASAKWPNALKASVEGVLYEVFKYSTTVDAKTSKDNQSPPFLSPLIFSKLGSFVIRKYELDIDTVQGLSKILDNDAAKCFTLPEKQETWEPPSCPDIWSSLKIIRFKDSSVLLPELEQTPSLEEWFIYKRVVAVVPLCDEQFSGDSVNWNEYAKGVTIVLNGTAGLLGRMDGSSKLLLFSLLRGLSMSGIMKATSIEQLQKVTGRNSTSSCINDVLSQDKGQAISTLVDIVNRSLSVPTSYLYKTRRLVELIDFFITVMSSNARSVSVALAAVKVLVVFLDAVGSIRTSTSVSEENFDFFVARGCNLGQMLSNALITIPAPLLQTHISTLKELAKASSIEKMKPPSNASQEVFNFLASLAKLSNLLGLGFKISPKLISVQDEKPNKTSGKHLLDEAPISNPKRQNVDGVFNVWQDQAKANIDKEAAGFKIRSEKVTTPLTTQQKLMKQMGMATTVAPKLQMNKMPSARETGNLMGLSDPYLKDGRDVGITICEDEDGSRTKERADRLAKQKAEKRTAMLTDQSVDSKRKTLILPPQRETRRLRYTAADFMATVLKWNPKYKGKFYAEKEMLKNIPFAFDDTVSYVDAFLPLLYQETYEQVLTSMMNTVPEDTFSVTLKSIGQVDDTRVLKCVPHNDRSVATKLAEQDLLLVEVSGRSFYGIITAITSKRDVAFDITVCNSGQTKLNNLGVTITCTRVTSVITPYREFTALISMDNLPFKRDIIRGNCISFVRPSDHEIKRIQNRYQVNRSQAEVILSTLNMSPGFALVQGPPGTGKTRTIVTIIGAVLSFFGHTLIKVPTSQHNLKTVASNNKILCCAPSNAAVDEIAIRLMKGVPDGKGSTFIPKFVRIGQIESMHPTIRDFSLDTQTDKLYSEQKSTASESKTQSVESLHNAVKELEVERSMLRERHQSADDAEEKVKFEQQIEEVSAKLNVARTAFYECKQLIKEESNYNERLRKRLRKDILTNADVILATLSGAGHDMFSEFNSSHFNTVIIDEACQAVETSTLIPLRFANKKCILVGDPNQLPPTVISQVAVQHSYDRSLFVRLMNKKKDCIFVLQTQYRMDPVISKFASVQFYESRLLDDTCVVNRDKAPWNGSSFSPILFLDMPYGFEKKSGGNMKSFFNVEEAKLCVHIVAKLCVDFPSVTFVGKIGIITFYKHQVRVIKDLLINRFGSRDILNSVSVNTVDGFQGQEKEIIILSVVRTKNIGFTSDTRRVNVAITRAQRTLVVVGNRSNIRKDTTWSSLLDYCENANAIRTVRDYQPITAELPRNMLAKPPERFVYPEEEARTRKEAMLERD